MLRTKEERARVNETQRTFTTIESWDEFLERWEDIDTVQEAIGLLYAGATIFPFDNRTRCSPAEQEDKELLNRMEFYREISDQSNKQIAEVAEQVLVKGLLDKILIIGRIKSFCAVISALEFLEKPRESLRYPPYPRFVSQFLVSIHELWSVGVNPEYVRGVDHQNLQPHTRVIVRTLCAWGLGYLLGCNVKRKAIPFLKEYLDEVAPKAVKDVFMNLSGHGEPPTRLDSENAIRGAACSLLKLQYWIGDGVNAKYDREIKPS